MLRLSRYERKEIENRRFRSNAVSLIQNFRQKRSPPPIIFARLVRPMNAYNSSLTVFTRRNFVADFLQPKCDFRRKSAFFVFESPLGGGGLGATYDDHLRLIGKRADFLLVLLNLFFARCYGWGATSEYRFKIGDFAPMGVGWRKISGRRDRPTKHSSSQKTRLNDL